MQKWLETMLEVDGRSLERMVRAQCAYWGMSQYADDVVQETYLRMAIQANWIPNRGSFTTWGVEQAKHVLHRMTDASRHVRYGGEATSGVSLEYEYLVAEVLTTALEDDIERSPFLAPGDLMFSAPVTHDKYAFEEQEERQEMLARMSRYLASLTAEELKAVEYSLSIGHPPSSRELAPIIGRSHTYANRVLRNVRKKAAAVYKIVP